MKTPVAILLIVTLLSVDCVLSKKSDGFLAFVRKSWEPFMQSAQKNVYESAMAALVPILKLSRNHMDPIGGELIDKLISDIPIFTDAMCNNNLTTIHKILEETQKSLDVMATHITHAQFQKLAVERNIAFSSLVTCIHHGKCGSQAFVHFLSGSISPMKMLYTLLSD